LSTIFVDFIFVDFDKIPDKFIYFFDIFWGNYFLPTLPSWYGSHYICTTVVPFILSMGTSKIIKVQVLDYQAIRSTPFIIWRLRLLYRHLLPNVVHPKVPLRYAGFTLVISSNMTFYLCDKWLNYSRSSRLRTESNNERV
jgi:hypothetical protein